ncbi:MAG: hypothetical protein JWM53_4117 [bacterium]|nr:hypothetical protein [bacterium]
MLQRQHIWKRRGLARRVLRRGFGIVSNSALYGMVIYCIGCVIPTPLDRAPAPTNYGPVWVTSRVQPPFGPTSLSVSSTIALSLVATDPNPDDTLTVRLFVPSATAPGGLQYLSIEKTLTSAPDMDDPNLRIGSLEPPLCRNAASGTSFDVFAYVADRDFSGVTATAPGGLTDSNHWELTCM